MWRKRRRGRFFKKRRRYWYRRYGRNRRRNFGHWKRRVSSIRNVKEYVPRRHRYLYIRGWEPLGNLCSSDYASSEATPYTSVEPQGSGAVWHGTWGRHYFTLANLQLRANAFWNRWSEDWSGFDFVQFMGGTIKIPQTAPVPWMINFDEYLQVKLKDYNPPQSEDLWVHPGILLNDPKTHIIFPPATYKKRKFYSIRVNAPPGWKGFARLPDGESFVRPFIGCWTLVVIRLAFYNEPDSTSTQDACPIAPWWASNNNLNRWASRKTYKQCSDVTQLDDKSWGPFLPCKYNGFTECSLFFQYRLKFKLAGYSIWPTVPSNLVSNGLVPQPPGVDGPQTERSTKKRNRPQDESDIWPGDLDSDGLLTERAFKRIAGHHSRPFRRQLEQRRRLRHIAEKLTRILSDRGLIKRRRMGDDPPPHPP
nr:ORF1 [Torque teno felis virus]